MGEEIEIDRNYFCSHKFPLLPIPAANMHLPDHPSSGMATPPLQTLAASVPFKWEEEPGKPRPCTDIIALPERLELELPHPPCRMEPIRMASSANAVLDGPYSNVVGGRPKFYSFRLFKDSSSSDQSHDESSSSDHDDVDVLFGKKMMSSSQKRRRRYWFLKLKKSTGDHASFGSSHTDDHERCSSRKMRRSGSFSRQPSSSTHLWAAVYQSLKQVIPWKSTGKSNKDGSI